MPQTNRNYPIDTLRTIATMLVVLLHVSAYYLKNTVIDNNFFFSNIVDSFCRISVPLFVLISGRFLLGNKEDYKVFYQKRASRILIPLIVWSIIYSIPTLLLDGTDQFVSNFVKGVPFYHLWYLYMLLGLYLITPFLNDILLRFSRTNLWAIALGLMIVGMINHLFTFYYGNINFFLWSFLDYSGYFLLGYLLKDSKHIPNYALSAVYIVTGLVIAGLTFVTVHEFGSCYFYIYLSPFVILGSVSIYKLFSQLKFSQNILSVISKYSFGIYLTHAGFLVILNKLNLPCMGNAVIGIPVKFIIVFVVSLLSSWVISKIKYLNKII